MRTGNRQQMLLMLLAALAAVFAIGFFAGRRSIPYEVSAQTGRTVQNISDAAESAAQDASNGQGDETVVQEDTGYPIDLNRATLEELMTLPRIGQTLAQRVLDYRAQYGRFSAPEQLIDVEGIGEATFAGLKDLVCVEGSK